MSDWDSQHEHVLSLVRKMIPPLSPKLHKGQAGRIGVIGGSGDYSGAPFFSAMGAMRFGVDLAHVICQPGAGAVIKTYSPDLIVHCVLVPEQGVAAARDEIKALIDRLHVLVIGPGLGRDEFMQGCAREALKLAREKEDLGVVVDADGLWLLQSEPELVKGWKGPQRLILTPNIMEFKRLCEATGISSGDPEAHCAELARVLDGVTIIQKGGYDRISNGAPLPAPFLESGAWADEGDAADTLVDKTTGGLKRVGGQGDILSGSAGALLAWGLLWSQGAYDFVGHKADPKFKDSITLLAAYGASAFNRTVSKRGWEAKRRAMVTHDLVDLVGPVYEDMFGKYQEEEGEGVTKGKL